MTWLDQPDWRIRAERGEWFEAAKSALLDQTAASGSALTCATLALVDAISTSDEKASHMEDARQQIGAFLESRKKAPDG